MTDAEPDRTTPAWDVFEDHYNDCATCTKDALCPEGETCFRAAAALILRAISTPEEIAAWLRGEIDP